MPLGEKDGTEWTASFHHLPAGRLVPKLLSCSRSSARRISSSTPPRISSRRSFIVAWLRLGSKLKCHERSSSGVAKHNAGRERDTRERPLVVLCALRQLKHLSARTNYSRQRAQDGRSEHQKRHQFPNQHATYFHMKPIFRISGSNSQPGEGNG